MIDSYTVTQSTNVVLVKAGFAFIWFANTTKGRFFVVGSWLIMSLVASAISSFALAQSLSGNATPASRRLKIKS